VDLVTVLTLVSILSSLCSQALTKIVACSSSLAAIQIACTSLWSGECDTAIAGGVNVLTAPDIFAGLSRGMFLSKTGGCKTFDANADGYCRADGVGTVILKRLDDAEADNDNIIAVVLGTATNHSAEAISITHPHAGAQSYLYESILYTAGVDAHDISYIEMHGTGTQAGDKIEANSVMDVFAPRHRQRSENNPLYMGAVKSNVGHGEAAAGITALCKMLLMLRHNMIPQHVGIKTVINPAMPPDMKERQVKIAFENTPWVRPPGGKRVAFLNNFSAAGGNTGLLLEDAPERPAKKTADPRAEQVITVSGKSIASIKTNVQNLVAYLQENPATPLEDLAYSTTARKAHFTYRVAVTGSKVEDIKTKLAATLGGSFSPISATQPKMAFVFTGQGAFYPALGAALYKDSASFRGHIQQMNSMGMSAGFPSIIPAIDGSSTLFSPLVTQLALCCVQMALTKTWSSWGIKPSVIIGHSLGEYAALNAAGVLSVSDTINLVGQRASLLMEKCVEGLHAMLAVKGTLSSIYQAAQGKAFEVACINGNQEIVLSATVGQITALAEVLKQAGLKCIQLDVPYAFHSSQVEPILEDFKAVAAGATFHAPKVPVISPLLSSVVTESGTFDAEYLCRHARESVNFLGALQEAQSGEFVDEKTAWIELGPHPICNNMVQNSIPPMSLSLASLRKNEDPWKTVAASLSALYRGGFQLDWPEIHRDFDESHRLLELPLYAFEEKNHWIDYVGDWTLTKGQPIAPPPAPVVIAAEPPKPSKLSTTSVQRIVEESFDGMKGRVVVETDITEPVLNSAVTGHLVNGAGLCPSVSS
jgi:acyl transferase domain-containing protein